MIFDDNGKSSPAWLVYVLNRPPYLDIFEVLVGEYERAVSRIPEEGKDPCFDEYHEQLTEHLMNLYMSEKLSINSALIRDFFKYAPNTLRAHAILSIGRWISKMEGELDGGEAGRLIVLWEARVATAESKVQDCTEELPAFGWWFTSEKLEIKSSVHLLRRGLTVMGNSQPDHLVIERLAILAKDQPEEAIQCLSLMVGSDLDGTAVFTWRKHARDLLTEALVSSSPEAKSGARDLVNRLVARGFVEFAALLE